MDIMKYTKEI